MDVDTERMTADDEHMDYEENLASVRDEDDDEMMEDEEEKTMDAEPMVTTTDALPSLSGDVIRTPCTTTAPQLSPSAPPDAVELLSRPLPSTSTAPETEISPPTEDAPSLHSKQLTRGGPLMSLTPSGAANAPVMASSDAEPSSSAAHLPMPISQRAMRSTPAPSEGGGLESVKSPRPPSEYIDGNEGGEEEEYYEENGAEYPTDIHSLPPIILNLPAIGARTLFSPLQDDGQQLKLPVWLENRQEELGEASLSDVWSAIRAEMAREGLVKTGELVVAEKQMDLKMGEVSSRLG